MRRYIMAVVVTAVLFAAGVSYGEECTTVGAKDCRASNQPGVCYWWECQQTGSVRQMIFLGEKCTCPRSGLDGGTRFARLCRGTTVGVCGWPASSPLSE